MKFKDFIKEELEKQFLGRTIVGERNFVVAEISVEDGSYGDPPFEITFASQRHIEGEAKWKAWQNENNPLGGVICPKEIEQPWRDICKEAFCLSGIDKEMPEIQK